MDKYLLTALAFYCNHPDTSWSYLDGDPSLIKAKYLFQKWAAKNIWRKPWDGFIEIIREEYPSARRISNTYSNAIATFQYYGQTWGIEE